MTILIHHNPDCGTSRNTLEMIRLSGEPHIVVEYLKEGWTKPQLQALFTTANITPKEAIRSKGTPAEELGLLDSAITDDQILDAMVNNPILVNRPIVCSPKGVVLCRPSEKVLELLPEGTLDHFTKEDGQTIER